MNGFGLMQKRINAMRELPRAFSAAAAPQTLQRAKDQFLVQQDPYGRPWVETKTAIDFDKGNTYMRMRLGLSVSGRTPMIAKNFSTELVNGRHGGFWLNNSHFSFDWHQYGVPPRLPARPMVPYARQGLGTWSPMYHLLCRDVWTEICTRAL